MLVSGITKCSLLDFPGEVAAIIFTLGCNFRCGYCHNPEFVLPERVRELAPHCIAEAAMMEFLRLRAGKLTGVVISGGEPTMQPDLVRVIREIKALGYKVKLDTNGARPAVLQTLLNENLLDYIAMDVKTAISDYPRLVGERLNPEHIAKSIQLIQRSGVAYEFRTTLIAEYHTRTILQTMARELAGARLLYLQQFRSQATLKESFGRYHGVSADAVEEVRSMFAKTVREVGVRG